MSNNRKKSIFNLTVTAMMIALSIVLERFLPIVYLDTTRLGLGKVPIILTGAFVSPLYGAAAGLIADLVGCIGLHIPNPLITVSSALIGFLPALGFNIVAKIKDSFRYSIVSVTVCICITSLISRGLITTAGLTAIGGFERFANRYFTMLGARAVTIILQTVIDVVCVYLVLKSSSVVKSFNRGGKSK